MSNHTRRHPIKWRKPNGPIKGMLPGHSPVQYGRSSYLGDSPMAHEGRSFVKCECGGTFSGRGESGGMASYQRHVNRLKPVHNHGEGQPCNAGCMPSKEFKGRHRADR